jgi:hypothetical protein
MEGRIVLLYWYVSLLKSMDWVDMVVAVIVWIMTIHVVDFFSITLTNAKHVQQIRTLHAPPVDAAVPAVDVAVHDFMFLLLLLRPRLWAMIKIKLRT